MDNPHPAYATGAARIGILGNNENDCVTCDSLPESGLVLEEAPMTPTRVETKLQAEITETSTSKQWDTFLFSKITRE